MHTPSIGYREVVAFCCPCSIDSRRRRFYCCPYRFRARKDVGHSQPEKVQLSMQMLCKVSNVFSDVRCPVCGQGFLVYWTRIAASSRDQQRQFLLEGLRTHHRDSANSSDVHAPAFYLTDEPAHLLFDEPALMPAPGLLGVYS